MQLCDFVILRWSYWRSTFGTVALSYVILWAVFVAKAERKMKQKQVFYCFAKLFLFCCFVGLHNNT